MPRDKDGRIFLGESPIIMKYLVHSELKASSKTQGNTISVDSSKYPIPSAADQENYLHSFSGTVLGC